MRKYRSQCRPPTISHDTLLLTLLTAARACALAHGINGGIDARGEPLSALESDSGDEGSSEGEEEGEAGGGSVGEAAVHEDAEDEEAAALSSEGGCCRQGVARIAWVAPRLSALMGA